MARPSCSPRGLLAAPSGPPPRLPTGARSGSLAGPLAALRTLVPGLPGSIAGATTLALEPYAGSDRETQVDAVAEVLAAEVAAKIRGDLFLVVDDAHELAADPATLRVLEGLCRHAPPRLRIVLASRHDLGFAVQRLRIAGDLVELTGHDLHSRQPRPPSSSSRCSTRTLSWPSRCTGRPQGGRRRSGSLSRPWR